MVAHDSWISKRAAPRYAPLFVFRRREVVGDWDVEDVLIYTSGLGLVVGDFVCQVDDARSGGGKYRHIGAPELRWGAEPERGDVEDSVKPELEMRRSVAEGCRVCRKGGGEDGRGEENTELIVLDRVLGPVLLYAPPGGLGEVVGGEEEV